MKHIFFAAIITPTLLLTFQNASATEQEFDNQNEVKYSDTSILNNKIYNDSTLDLFFNKVNQFENGLRDKVTILHLGDSHIQMGYFVGEMRRQIDSLWRIAEWGSIFPYQIAHYNPNYVETKVITGKWSGSNYLSKEKPFYFGSTGFSATTNDSSASFEISVKNSTDEWSLFDRVKIFYLDSLNNYDINIIPVEDNTDSMANLTSRNVQKDYAITKHQDTKLDSRFKSLTIDLNRESKKINLSVIRKKLGGNFQLLGIQLERKDSKGIIYNNCGVGGAQFSNLCTNSTYSIEQVKAINPDLIIISYGSNESYKSKFDSGRYDSMVNDYIVRIKNNVPNVSIILTAPPDTRSKNMYPRNTTAIQKIFKNVAKKTNISFWDLRSQMGGDGSLFKWLKTGLAANDKLHFTKKGYSIQAQLFMQAIVKSFNSWKNISNKK